jgi:predicted ATPase
MSKTGEKSSGTRQRSRWPLDTAFRTSAPSGWWSPGGRGFFYHAEMLRLKAELMLQTGHAPERAEAQLQDASRIAREQSARSPELLIALGLARLWAARGDIEEAKRLVGEARRGVEEGQGTPDSREAEEFVR